MVGKPRLLGTLAAGLSVAMVASACSSSVGNEVSRDEASLDGVVAAFYLSPQTDGFAGGEDRGYVVLVDRDGEYHSLPNSGMDAGNVVWSPDGLYYSDRDSDYLLGDKLRSFKSPKTDQQFTALHVAERETHVGIYNEGMPTPDRYQSQIVVTGAKSAKSYLVEGRYSSAAVCDGAVYGIADHPSHHGKVPLAVATRLMLARLYPAPKGTEKVIGWQPEETEEPTVLSTTLPCRDGKIAFLTIDAGFDTGEDEPPAIATWDASTGEYQQVRLLLRADGCRGLVQQRGCRHGCGLRPLG